MIQQPPVHLSTPISHLSLPRTVRFFPAEKRAVSPRRLNKNGLPLKVSEWNRAYRMVMKGKKAVPWSDDLMPYGPFIMDLWSLPWVRKVYLCWAPRTGKTNIAQTCLLYSLDQDPTSAMYVMPIEAMAKDRMKKHIRPSVQAIKHMAKMLLGSYDATNTYLALSNGATVTVTWGTSEAMLSSEDVQIMIVDEADKKEYSPGKGPNPLFLAEVRTGNHPHNKKILVISSPSEEPSNIWKGLKTECTIVYTLEVRCPICNHYQVMTEKHIIYPETDPRKIRDGKLARYACEKCGVMSANHWNDHVRNEAIRKGRWVPGRITENDEWELLPDNQERHTVVGAWLPGWNSPDVSLSDVAYCAIMARRDIDYEMKLASDYHAKPYSTRVKINTEAQLLSHRTKLPSGIVPKGTLALTCGVDVQKIGFWFVIRAWMEDLTSHKILHGFVPTFFDIARILFDTRYPVEDSNETMAIWRAAMDTGGGLSQSEVWTRTEEIYEFLHTHRWRGIVFGTKGASRTQNARVKVSTIETMPKSRLPIPGGLEIRILDTMQLKQLLHWRLSRTGDETQRFYLDADTDTDYAKQFLAEHLVSHANGKKMWVSRGENHLFDCEVLAAACADRQWYPSLTTLTEYFHEQQTQPVQPVQIHEPEQAQTQSWRW